MIRKRKMFSRPKKLYQKTRIEEENKLLKIYGLKNKREVWKALAKINYYRTRAMALAKAPESEQAVFLGKLSALGFKAGTISDVLALQVEDILKRRLPTIVAGKQLAYTVQQARQMVVHKKIKINGKIVNIPGYIVSLAEEGNITSSQKLVPRKSAEEESSDSSDSSEESSEDTE